MHTRRRRENLQRLERMQASSRFDGRTFHNTHPVVAGLKPGVERPTLREFLGAGEGRIPAGPLPLVNPIATWAKRAEWS